MSEPEFDHTELPETLCVDIELGYDTSQMALSLLNKGPGKTSQGNYNRLLV